MIYLV